MEKKERSNENIIVGNDGKKIKQCVEKVDIKLDNVSFLFNLLNPHDASKQHFASLKNVLIF